DVAVEAGGEVVLLSRLKILGQQLTIEVNPSITNHQSRSCHASSPSCTAASPRAPSNCPTTARGAERVNDRGSVALWHSTPPSIPTGGPSYVTCTLQLDSSSTPGTPTSRGPGSQHEPRPARGPGCGLFPISMGIDAIVCIHTIVYFCQWQKPDPGI